MNQLIEFSLRVRGLVVAVMIGVIVFGVYSYRQMAVDAFPDISPVMVPVFAEAHGMAPEEVERLITFPIENTMNGLPDVTQIKSTSAFGMAVVYVYFKDGTDIYFARQLVAERMAAAMADLPEMHEPPKLGPISTGLGQIFIYYLTLDETTDTEGKEPDVYLRELNDWVVKYQLQSVQGVTDILSIGGHVLQYQVRVDPYELQRYNISMEELVEAIRSNNRNAGGQFMVLGSEESLVRGIGLLQNLEQIRDIPIRTISGVPLTVGAVAKVEYGSEIRRGVVTHNGEEEVVSGLVLKLYGENTSEVIEKLYAKVADVQASLPQGVKLVPYYEQSELVDLATGTVKKAFLAGAVLVALTLLVFMGNLRSAVIVVLSLPVCALIAVIMMGLKGVSANLMSLGGIAVAIGMLGDGAIVMVENIYRHLGLPGNRTRSKAEVILDAAREVSRPVFFSIAIIIMVFLPIYTLQGVEGKMFTPMAFTITFALLGSMVTALILSPVLSYWLVKQGEHKESRLVEKLKNVYRPLLKRTQRRRGLVVICSMIAFVASLMVFPMIGTEFIPTLEEGSILIGVAMAPSISLGTATDTIMTLEREIVEFPEVEETISRIGRPEAGSHPHPVNYAEIHIAIKPGTDKARLIAAMNEKLSSVPGVQLNFTQPIQNAFDELLSGIKAQLAIKVFGEDLDVLQRTAAEIKEAVKDVPGLVDLSVEQSFGQPQVQIVADRAACARYGIAVSDVLELVELAIGGEPVDQIYLNNRRFRIHVRYQESFRASPDAIRNLLVYTEDGSLVSLEQVATVREVIGPLQINREKNQRRWIVQGNVRGRDLGSVAADIRARIDEQVKLPNGYFVEYGGQFENQQRAMQRLMLIVPLVFVGVFILLWMAFGAWRDALIIIINVPLALIGGIAGLLITGEYLSVPAAVGFIALFGIAVQNGVVLVSYFNQLRRDGMSLQDAVLEGGMLRLRPVLMTALTTVLGLLPLLLSQGIGSEVQRPLAVVVVFGLTTSTLLTLFVIPAVYSLIESRLPKEFETLRG
ncbi:MAG: efflux RND transporter permease subunit [Kiritimatiellaeota bacterium]|nr:efflux RND transporter permease subunit [Kiritimatiellota bacterium]